MNLFANLGASYEVRPRTGFTNDLMNNLIASRSKVEVWVQHEKAKAEKEAEEYRQQLMQEQKLIDTKSATLLALQLQRGLSVSHNGEEKDHGNLASIATKKQALEEQQGLLESEIRKLESGYEHRKKRVEDIAIEEGRQRQRAQDARNLKAKVKEAKKTTVDDLTRGIINYKFTGLDFEKTNTENELLFTFTQLDPIEPTRKFSFLLQVDNNDQYQIAKCQPSLEPLLLVEIAKVLNETDDMSYLVRMMRRAFANTL